MVRFDAEAVGLYDNDVLLRLDRANRACRMPMFPVFCDDFLRTEMVTQYACLVLAVRGDMHCRIGCEEW